MRLFLYGTLQPGCGTTMARWIERRLITVSPATISGRLFALRGGPGYYPAVKPGPGVVEGMLCTLSLRPGDLARLDRYEGAQYQRKTVKTYSNGRHAKACAYVWAAALPPGARRIEANFLAWLSGSTHRIYGGQRGT